LQLQSHAAVAPTRSFDEAAAAQMEKLVADFGRVYQQRNEALREVSRAHHEALLRLSLAAEMRDDDTGMHIVRIGFMAEALALLLGESLVFAQMLRRAAPMHDVGKIGIADRILKKPGPLSEAERSEMNQHPSIGAHILGRSQIPLFELAAEIALTHHERWDGCGYPKGLSGRAIPLSGRIVAICDFFDALTMDRCYRPACSDEDALLMLQEQAGRAFDPEIVACFVSNAFRLIAVRDHINRRPPTFESLVEID
jgi:putative two-component system response regulator